MKHDTKTLAESMAEIKKWLASGTQKTVCSKSLIKEIYLVKGRVASINMYRKIHKVTLQQAMRNVDSLIHNEWMTEK